MFSRTITNFKPRIVANRLFSTSTSQLPKVAVVGAAGGIGQALSLLLKCNPQVGSLALCDIINAPGVAADLSHINTEGTVTAYVGQENMGEALKGAKVIVVPAGIPRKPGMSRDDLFSKNAGIVESIARCAAENAPEAIVALVVNPVNSMVPLWKSVYQKAGVYDPRKLVGVTTLDITRSNTFVGNALKRPMKEMNVTVCGGHAGTTIMPILSGVPGIDQLSSEEIAKLTHRIQFGGDEVVNAKNGSGSATLSMAYAAALFTERLLLAIGGKKDVFECAYVESDVAKKNGCDFFSTPVRFGPNGVEEIMPLPSLSAAEQANYDAMIKDLAAQVQKGYDFGK